MKKGIVALLVVLALVIIVSPAIIGRLAEKSVDDNLNWAAAESGDLVVSSEKFDRGWFSSEGQHRVEIKEGKLKTMLESMGAPADSSDLPVLVISTHLDHGLIPVTSMSREKGSLLPGLGSAVSTLSIELADGEKVDIPGTIYSDVGLGGELQSTYVVEAGSREDNDMTASWEATEVEVTTNPSSGDVEFAGNIGALSFADDADSVEIDGLSFSGSQAPTKFGFAIGDMKLALDAMTISSGGVQAGGLKHMSVDGKTELDNGRLSGRTLLEMESQALPQLGEFSVVADISLEGADAAAVGALQKALEAQGATPDPGQMFTTVEDDLKRLLAAGLELRFDQLDVTLPMGTVTTKLDIKVPEDDAATFDWTSLLISTEASADISVPEALVDMAMQMNPEAGAIIGMGFLQKNGDVYEMEAEYKKGLLTINGAPMPIPLGAFQ
ncbi:MAG: YdgA family protein [Gammaproteobacteria bacterium]|nr:YdgA family protein [Gammaproteobacteria bacterium]